MTPRRGPLTAHFQLDEFLPVGWDGSIPPEVLGNLLLLTEGLLEPARAYLGRPIRTSSGWRPEEHNAAVGGVATSDHPIGRAADIWASGSSDETWQDATLRLFHWMRVALAGKFGQLILEDHRAALGCATALWIHAAIPSPKHPGHGDPNAVLISPAPKQYQQYEEPRA